PPRAVGQAQLIAAIGQEPAFLAGVPVLVGDPARGLGAEQDRRPAAWFAGEDPVAGGELAVQLFLRDVGGALVEGPGGGDAVHREAAQAVALVVPGIQVPVVAIVGQPLRGDLAAGALVGGPGEVLERQPAPV